MKENTHFGVTTHVDKIELCQRVKKINDKFGIIPIGIFNEGEWICCLWLIPLGMTTEEFCLYANKVVRN